MDEHSIYNQRQTMNKSPKAKARILYWKEIPVQFQVSDNQQTVSVPLAPKFQEAVDAIAMFDQSIISDEYLNSWIWGNWQEFNKTATETTSHLSNKFNCNFPEDFVKRIRDLHKSGSRSGTPGSIDHWVKETQ